MPKTRTQKEQIIKDLKDKLKEVKSLVLATFEKISVSDDQVLRKELKKEKIDYQVIKKTLLKKALEKQKYKKTNLDNLRGNLALAISREDEVAPARILDKFSSEHKEFQIVGGILENQWVAKDKIRELAKLPNKPELLTKMIYSIKSPISGLVNVLGGNIRNLIYILYRISMN